MAVKYPDAKKREALRTEFNVNNSNWMVLKERANNITGKLPMLPVRLFGEKTNAEVMKEFGLSSTRQASKIRNHRKPLPKTDTSS